ncbi:MAG: M48 family metalloprotease [Candidatus Rokubacteria bacterium]|nr:M48 family metalloprotease [Candidatus Rokubacteria bacterium]
MKRAGTLPRLALGLVLLASCATPRGAPGAVADVKPGERPPIESDEAGLWMAMDRVEASLKTSGHLVTDSALNAYVRGVVCRLAGAHCGDVRVYVVQTPHFNASMAPNGMMQVWTGLLLRADNEAQLAYVLGHEIGHYLRRHSVQLFRDLRAKADASLFFSVLTAAAGVGFVGPLAQLAMLSSVFAFSRDNEREADDVGFELMVRAGYEPHEAPKIWEALLKERAAVKDAEPLVFFATHPSTDERVATLKGLADKAAAAGGADVGRERYLAAMLPFRATMLRDELRLRRPAATQLVLDRLLAAGAAPGEVHFFQGELHRLRGEAGDDQKAIAAYEKAATAAGAPAETQRNLGLVLMKTGDRTRARAAFARYLERRPDAQDREIIRDYLKRLE